MLHQSLSRRTFLRMSLAALCYSSLVSQAALLSSCSLRADEDMGKILIVGSSALQPLVEVASEEYNAKNPRAFITVQGGGSGQGLSQVIQGAVQIGNSDLFAEEKGLDASGLIDNKVCVSGIGIICHKDIELDTISFEQLQDIFSGSYLNWKELGGQDLDIVLINRAHGSGTRACFESTILKGKKAKPSQEQDNNGTVIRMVSATPGAISYVSFSFLNDKVKALKLDNISPTPEQVQTNAWPIWAYEHMYTQKNPEPTTQEFIDFMFGDIVQQEIIPQLGYISIHDMKVHKDYTGKVTAL